MGQVSINSDIAFCRHRMFEVPMARIRTLLSFSPELLMIYDNHDTSVTLSL
jgi:hypothetical protein